MVTKYREYKDEERVKKQANKQVIKQDATAKIGSESDSA